MNIKQCAAVAVMAFGLTATAAADFSGYYAVSNWSTTDNAFGTVDTTNAPGSITLTSGNSQLAGDTFFTITAPTTENISFNWSYVTNDIWGQSGTDAFGYVLNGVVTTLIDPNQDVTIPNQSGIASFTVKAGDVFGFDANTFDGWSGSSVTIVSNFSAVPLPGAFWFFASTLAGLTGIYRRQAFKPTV